MHFFAVLLGRKHQLPLIKAIKKMGFIPIVLDNDFSFLNKIKITDVIKEKVKNIFSKSEIIERLLRYRDGLLGFYTRSYGKAMEVVYDVMEEMGFVSNPVKAISHLQNKKISQTIFKKLKIPIPPTFSFRDILSEDFFIVKNKKLQGKIGVKLKKANFYNYLTNFYHIKEKFIQGKEYIAYFFVLDYQPYLLIVSRKKRLLDILGNGFLDLYHFAPINIPQDIIKKLYWISKKIIDFLEIRYGPLIFEFIRRGKEIFLLEAIPDFGGEYIADFVIPNIYSVDIFEIIVKYIAFLDNNVKFIERKKEGVYILTKYLYPKSNKILKLPKKQTLYSKYSKNIIFIDYFYKPYNKYKKIGANSDRIGCIIYKGNSYRELIELNKGLMYGEFLGEFL